jgi:hypothetical protein
MPGLVAGLDVEHLGGVVVRLAPAQVHAQEHLGPVGGVGAARARVDRDDRRPGVVFAAEQPLELRGVELALGGDQLLERLPARSLVVRLRGELEQHFRVVERADQRVVARHLALGAALLAQQLLRALAVVPQLRIRGLLLELGDPLADPREVKDAPGARPSVGAGPQSARKARDRWGLATSPRSWAGSIPHPASARTPRSA